MRILYFDAFAGISGDMAVGALLDLGVDFERLRADLLRLPLTGYELQVSERLVNGIRACKFDVHVHSHSAKDHSERRTKKRAPGKPRAVRTRGYAHRQFRDIRAMIGGSSLRKTVKERALAIFSCLAEAEARVHGVAPDDVAFHEIGAVDSIVDIVGAAIGFVELAVEEVYVSALPSGSGKVHSQHGVIPVPAPATVELLRGFPIRLGDGEGELVTPTGAAIVAALARRGEPAPPFVIERIGHGAGTRILTDRPNVLRALLGAAAPGWQRDEVVIVETNIDDANPEIYDHVMEQLFAVGARDVFLSPIQMKKNRPGVLLRVIADAAQREVIAAAILRETTAIGVRFFSAQRLVLRREIVRVNTEYGAIEVKVACAPDGTRNVAPEYDSCRAAAAKHRVPLKTVYQAAIRAATKITSESPPPDHHHR